MRRTSLAGLTAIALTGGTLLSAAPAQAADPTTIYVRKQSSTCSDSGAGTLQQPFCSIGPAAAVVTAGQTVDIGDGPYPERVTITNSGTPDQPIVFRAATGATVTLSGATAGLVIDGQHDITIQNLRVNGAADAPALELHDASAIKVEVVSLTMATAATATAAVELTGVTGSTLRRVSAGATTIAAGLSMDAATQGVTVTSAVLMGGDAYDSADHSAGIRVAGPNNRIINNLVRGFSGAAIAVEPGATGTLVANNTIDMGAGNGIRNSGATGTAITNNTVQRRCLDGIRVDGASTGVSVQNNVLTSNGYFGRTYCDPADQGGLELGIYDDAVKDTVVDYNNAYHNVTPAPSIYTWDGIPLSLSAFRTASGQSAHDKETSGGQSLANNDSANSAAPGYQETDHYGTARGDDPRVPNTGAGPVTYADRGSVEYILPPEAKIETALDLGTTSVTVDASPSVPGFVPITSYEFTFGDGTVVTQDTPVATHRYAATGNYVVTVKVTGGDGKSGSTSQGISVLRRTGTVGLLALANLRYVGASSTGIGLLASEAAIGSMGQFDLADAGDGQVALYSRATRRYVSAGYAGTQVLTPVGTVVGNLEKFQLLRNADGTISLRSVGNNYYVSADAQGTRPLVANRTSIGPWEKFYRVTVTDADRSLTARVNSRYVTAESAGTKPLIANRTSVGPWERFDVVDLGNGQVALFAHANNRFVSADSKGTLPLIANRTAVGAWERFTLIRNSDGTVSLKAAVNSRYVSADGAGTKPLIANRTAIGLWEKFTLG